MELDVPLGFGSTLELEIECVSLGSSTGFSVRLNGDSLQTLTVPSVARSAKEFVAINGPLTALFMGELEPGTFVVQPH